MQDYPRCKDANIPYHRTRSRIQGSRARARDGQRAKVHGEVEIRAGERLRDGQPEQEIPRRDPALGDDVLAQQRDDDGAAAEDDGACEEEVREDGEAEGWGAERAAEDHEDDEGGEEGDDDAEAEFPREDAQAESRGDDALGCFGGCGFGGPLGGGISLR